MKIAHTSTRSSENKGDGRTPKYNSKNQIGETITSMPPPQLKEQQQLAFRIGNSNETRQKTYATLFRGQTNDARSNIQYSTIATIQDMKSEIYIANCTLSIIYITWYIPSLRIAPLT